MKTLLHLAAYIVIAFLSGCATYKYKDVTYHNREDAEAAILKDREFLLNAVTPLDKSIYSFATVVVPTKAIFLERGLKPGGGVDARDYVATSLYRSINLTAELIKKRNIFQKTEIIETSNPDHVEPSKGEVVIYLFFPTSKTMGWYYISQSTKRTPLAFDTGNPDRVQRNNYFIETVEKLAAGEPK
jgi:hypothetical protein